MTHRLDAPATYAIDAFGMFDHVERLGIELERAWVASSDIEIPARDFDRIAIVAMGGSAAAGDYLEGLAQRKSHFPIQLVRGYELPRSVDSRTLVVAVSYSGDTEETLACYRQAGERGCPRIVLTAGGELAERAASDGVPCYSIRYESEPRAALAHALAPLLRIADLAGAIDLCDADLLAVTGAHRALVANIGRGVPASENPAKQLAELLSDAQPLLVFSAEHLAPVGRRTKNQLAENAKVLATFEELPEATHNILVGFHAAGPTAAAIAFDAPAINPANRRRLQVLSAMFEEAGGAIAPLQMRGVSRLADMLEATAWGDLLSCYLAVLRGIDPSPTPALTRMREAMSQRVAG